MRPRQGAVPLALVGRPFEAGVAQLSERLGVRASAVEGQEDAPGGAEAIAQLLGDPSLWGGGCLRLSDHELQEWPTDHADLSPYYDRVEWTLGVAGTAEGLRQLPTGRSWRALR